MQLKFDFTKNGNPIIRIDEKTYFSFTNAALVNHGPWDSIFLHGFTETNYKGNIIKERVSESSQLSRIHFKNRTKKCLEEGILKHIISILKQFVNENGKILDSSIPDLQKLIEEPFEFDVKKKKINRLTLDEHGNVVKAKRGRKKKEV